MWLCLALFIAPSWVCFGAADRPRFDTPAARPADSSSVQRSPKNQSVNAPSNPSMILGMGLGLFATDPNYDYGTMISEIAALGATDVLMVVAWYQTSVGSHDIQPRVSFSPSETALVRTIKQARASGLRVTLLPIVRLIQRAPDEWRGRIAPEAGPKVWFQSYGRFLKMMARIAAKEDVSRLSVGSELVSMETYEDEWRSLINDIRGIFSGRLIYSANWDHYWSVPFWDALDDLGVTGYFELSTSPGQKSQAEFLKGWNAPIRDLERFRFVHQKPLIMTEVGYPSKTTAAQFPWDETRQAPLDHGLQARLYEVFCRAFGERRALDGFFVWNWFGFGGRHDSTYSPRNKPAAAVLRQCFHNPMWHESR